jgi:serine protease Do
MKKVRLSLAVVVAAAAGLSTPLLAQEGHPVTPLDTTVQQDLNVARSLSRVFRRASETIAPSVVHISQFGRVTTWPNGWFGRPENRLQQTGAGSGVIVSEDGYILTNNHVIAGAEEVRVKLNDGRELPAKVIGTDPATDLGVIKVDAKDLVAAHFGDSDALGVGDWVLAVGSPFGIFDNTVTAGIVSAKGRTNLASQSDERFEDYIQTDTAINKGNSGGPLVNIEGEVVGINSQIASPSGGSVGIGFSIPSSMARAVMDSIVQHGKVQRGWIGINMAPTPASISGPVRTEPRVSGAVVQEVVSGGPAERAGLRPGDVIVRFNGRTVDSVNRMRNLIAFTQPGTPVDIDVMRDGQSIRVNVPIMDTIEGRSLMVGGKSLVPFGFTVLTLPPDAVRRLGGKAVYINYVEPLSPAEEAGLQANTDVVFMVDGKTVSNAEEFDRALQDARGDSIRLAVQRGMQRGYVDVPRRK